jgi:hypothetical protein
MDSARQAGRRTTLQEGGTGEDARQLSGGRFEASDARQFGGRQHDKRMGVEDM